MLDATETHTSLWRKILSDLEEHLEPGQFFEFFASSSQEELNGRTLTVGVPSAFHRSWLVSNGLDAIYGALKRLGYGDDLNVQFVVRRDGQLPTPSMLELMGPGSEGIGPTQGSARTNGHQNHRHDTPPGGSPSANGRRYPSNGNGMPVGTELNPRYTFENFVIGENCRFAQAAAMKLSDPNSRAFNPLFIFGGVGLGKTHLLHAIGHKLREHRPDARVVYATSEMFTNAFIEALANGQTMEFRHLYRNVDLLLIDDVQFFVDKERMQAEFFHTFNALHETGRKIVLSSDRNPKELSPLEERLRSRFEWGLIVDVQVPDLETRVAILKKKANVETMAVPNDVLYYIAEHIQSNVRELEGALLRLKAYSSMVNRPIDLPMCTDLLGHLIYSAETADRISVEAIQESVCNYFDLRLSDLIGPSRQKKFAMPRHVAQYISRQLTGLSYPEIGQKFGGRDHTSVLHAYRKIEKEIGTDPRVANCVNYLTKQLRKGSDGTSNSNGKQ